MELLFEGVGREVSAQQGAVSYDSMPVVDKGYTIDSSRSIEAESPCAIPPGSAVPGL